MTLKDEQVCHRVHTRDLDGVAVRAMTPEIAYRGRDDEGLPGAKQNGKVAAALNDHTTTTVPL